MTGEQTLYIHVGAGKTGSTYLQAVMATARQRLAELGIDYPMDPGTERMAVAGRVTSGNLSPAAPLPETLARYPGAETSPRLLFSNETLHLTMTRPDLPVAASIREALPEARIEVLCYIRDPLDHAVSSYGQVVKRNGYVGDCAAYLRGYNMPDRLLLLDDVVREMDGRLSIVNYSRHRDDLLATFETWLGLAPGTLPEPVLPEINRSLTRAELELQRAFNEHMGASSAAIISDALCERLPDVRSETPPLARDDLAAFLDRMEQKLADPRFAALIPDAERPRVGTIDDHASRFPDPGQADRFEFSREQIDLLAQSMSSAIKLNARQVALRKKRRALRKASGEA
ncbi:MAG: hypothetical protein CML66_22785 [Rhodobacteraceae bacterium]|nr:hypothetical protein [Paracoccaceae bacterium]MAY47587.1 hypothetical protein [Paracoccaceae bacterium]|tara:strand:+ start:55 stop:1083 length:1029 start_codon:yes stop_codon:yes gene_type:complete